MLLNMLDWAGAFHRPDVTHQHLSQKTSFVLVTKRQKRNQELWTGERGEEENCLDQLSEKNSTQTCIFLVTQHAYFKIKPSDFIRYCAYFHTIGFKNTLCFMVMCHREVSYSFMKDVFIPDWHLLISWGPGTPPFPVRPLHWNSAAFITYQHQWAAPQKSFNLMGYITAKVFHLA